MKSVICPISNEKVPEHLPRVTASIGIVLILVYLYTQSLLLLSFLIVDFLLRGFNYAEYSIINLFARKISKALNLKSPKIDKAPKLFAARLGGIMFVAAFVMNIAGAFYSALLIVILVGFLSLLECVFSFCAGCYVYYYLVLPFNSKKN